jgi:hypothetical protein
MDTCRQIRVMCIPIAILIILTGVAGCTMTQPGSPAEPVPMTQDPGSSGNQAGPGPEGSHGSRCDPQNTGPRIPVPADTSVPIQDPVPGIRYSLNESASGRTVVLAEGDIFEITLRFAPGLAMR